MDANDFFKQAAQEPIDESSQKPLFSMRTGDTVLWGVVDISPTKTEIDDMRQKGLLKIDTDPITVAPWEEGITMTLLGIRHLSAESGEVTPLFEIDQQSGGINFPKGHAVVRMSVRVRKEDITKGYVYIINSDGRSMKVTFPSSWPTLTPQQKFSYWLYWIGARYKIPRGALSRGTTFYAFISKRKGKKGTKYEDQWFTDVRHSVQDENDKWIEAPDQVGTYDYNVLIRVNNAINILWEEFAKNKQEAPGAGTASDNGDLPF